MKIKNEKILPYLKKGIILALYMVLTSHVMNVTLTNSYFHFHLEEGPTAFVKIVYADAARPFVYRAFTPFLVRSLTYLTPQVIQSKIENIVNSRDILKIFGFKAEYATEYFWAFIILYLSLLGFAFAIRKFVSTFYHSPPFLADIAPIIALLCVSLLGSYFIYDYFNLLIFTVCLLLIARNKFRLFYPSFIIACFTKETSILLPFILFLNRSLYQDRKKVWRHLVIQSLIWGAIFIFLRYTFRNNPGQLLEFHLFGHNLSLFSNPANFLEFTANALPKGLNIFLVSSLAIMTFFFWKEKPPFLKRALFILIPISGLALLFGWIEEIRIYYETLPIWFTLCYHTVLKALDIPYEQVSVPTIHDDKVKKTVSY